MICGEQEGGDMWRNHSVVVSSLPKFVILQPHKLPNWPWSKLINQPTEWSIVCLVKLEMSHLIKK